MSLVEHDGLATLEVDLSDGGERLELYVDARDIVKTNAVSEQEFISQLYERGVLKLAEYNGGECAECAVDASKMGNMAFALGDKCLYRNAALGIEAEGRVTEIEEITENGDISTNIILGKEELNFVQKIKRETR